MNSLGVVQVWLCKLKRAELRNKLGRNIGSPLLELQGCTKCYLEAASQQSLQIKSLLRTGGCLAKISEARRVTLRTAALIVAVQRVADALLTRGIYP